MSLSRSTSSEEILAESLTSTVELSIDKYDCASSQEDESHENSYDEYADTLIIEDEETKNSSSSSSSEDDVCAICLDVLKLKYSVPCKHSFCYLCIKRYTALKPVCPLCRARIPLSIIEEASAEEGVTLEELKGEWMYSGRNGGWWYYDSELDEIIEKKYREDPTSIFEMEIMGATYTIDLGSMKQTAPNHFIRSIKRSADQSDSDIVKGIAGLRITGD